MTIEVRQMVIRSELNGGQAKDGQPPKQEHCCEDDEKAASGHRAQRAQLRQLHAQLDRLRER
ncbi:hypothetical protein PI87_24810 [Ralstonia sp. A12]|uniref:hypothetical protein n=1 Tax=Ralstonia sp. A12 TaxID=1217052 RepID=UPI000573C549|nr:hypothetical protein [Ralstonia sp. A12]KHK49724.1 hypothetical protein PI87_24810 [Ralstonia sp. A12]